MMILKEALLLTSELQIDAEVQTRIDLINMMIGTLYPGILKDEVAALRRRQSEIHFGYTSEAKEA
jgi:hypothetical protein